MIVRLAAFFLAVAGAFAGLPRATAAGAAEEAAIAAICDRAAARTAKETGVPIDVLRAIALTETGRSRRGTFAPWPWTVNMEGKGVWFATSDEALRYAERHFRRGARSFDVGCFQINYRWHGHAFASIEQMFDPLANARYAARFLGELHEEFGDWSRAAGAYHSRTPKFAGRYRARFDRIRARLRPMAPTTEPRRAVAVAADVARDTADATAMPPSEPAGQQLRDNRFPLLKLVNGERSHGSLVPLGPNPAGHRMIGALGPG